MSEYLVRIGEWLYKKQIDISPATPVDDYQVKVELTTTNFDYSKAKANGEDIRFYDSVENELSYWIEEWNASGTSTIWVKVANSGTSTIYMWYGNSSASSASDKDAVFEFFDDMESGSEKWTASGLWHLTSKKYHSSDHSFWYGQESTNNYDTGAANSGSLQSNAFTANQGAKLELWYWREVEYGTEPGYDKTIIYDSTDGSSWNQIWYKDSDNPSETAWTFLSVNLTENAKYIKFYFDTVDDQTNNYWGWFIDDVRIRKYTSPEPTTTVGDETICSCDDVVRFRCTKSISKVAEHAENIIADPDGTYAGMYENGDTVEIIDDDTSTTMFKGEISSVKPASKGGVDLEIKARGYTALLQDIKNVIEDYTSTEVSAIVKDLIDKYYPTITYTNVETTTLTLDAHNIKGISLFQAIKTLA
ncbi:MAG: DUF2341 domain-containing protein, partial [Candidatus Syntropharchaeales archaeon]